MVTKGTFREDLFYRLNVVRITLPPLRDRKEDIPLLAASIIKKFNRNMASKVNGFSPEALDMLKSHTFFGNVRELENVLERAIIFCDGELITVDDLDLRGSVSRPGTEVSIPDIKVDSEGQSLREMEKQAVIRALRRWEGNRTKASEELGISRRTLITKIAEYEITD